MSTSGNKYREEFFPKYPPCPPISPEEAQNIVFCGLWAAIDKEEKECL